MSLCHVAAVKRRPVQCHSTNYNYNKIIIFWFLGTMEFICSHIEDRILLKPMPGGVAGVAHFITGNKQTLLNRVCYFSFLRFLASKGSNYSEFFCIFCFSFHAPLDGYKL